MQNEQAAVSPVAPTIAADQPVKGATGNHSVVTMQGSALVSTIKVIDSWTPTFMVTMGSRGPRIREPSPPYSDSAPARPIRF